MRTVRLCSPTAQFISINVSICTAAMLFPSGVCFEGAETRARARGWTRTARGCLRETDSCRGILVVWISTKCGVSFLSHVGLVGARIKRIMTTDGSLVDLFKLVIAFQQVFLMLKEVLGIFEISVGNFMRNGCHVGLVGLIRRGLGSDSTLA